jgi:AraC-like DNA-binding protein
MIVPVARAHVFYGFDAFASRKGLDFDRLISNVGLTRQQLAEPDNEIPLNATAQLLANAATECADPCLGLHWAENYPKGASGVIGYLLPNAKTVRDAVMAMARYQALLIDPLDSSFRESEGTGKLEWRFPATFTAPRIQYASFAMAITVARLRELSGRTWLSPDIHLEHSELPSREDVLRILGPNVRFNCAYNAIHFPEDVLNKINEKADTRLFDLIRKLGDRLLAERRSESDIIALTRRAIVRKFESGDVTLDAVALELGHSIRILQARLATVGTNFETILQETRQGMADKYLRDSNLALTEIAYLLGFSELSAFTRACQRWFGVPPSDRRTALRRQTGMSS